MELAELIATAAGRQEADLLLKNVQLVNVLSGEIYPSEVALLGDRIAGVGPGYRAARTLDLEGRYLCPGFIDAHVHIESSMAPPHSFAQLLLPRGVTSVVADPHEIANVLGLSGIHYMLADSQELPLSVYLSAPSCVPASHMETSGATLNHSDLESLLVYPRVVGLGEVMNFPGVIFGDPEVLAKLETFHGRVIDGHAPGLSGAALSAYAAAGIGSDHECTSYEEALEKLRQGLTIFIREASGAHNLKDLIGLFRLPNHDRICLCTDDRHLGDLLMSGSVDDIVRQAIALGAPPIAAIRAATCNPAGYFRLHDRGVIAPGKRADLVVFTNLEDLRPDMVYCGGVQVAAQGEMLVTLPALGVTPVSSIRLKNTTPDFRIPVRGKKMRVIGIIPGQIVTQLRWEAPRIVAGYAEADLQRDLLKMAVLDRHHASGQIGLGFIAGMGLKRGALASTVAHDHHNLVVVGADDSSMRTAVHAVAEMQGGMVVSEGEQILARLPLPIAGLMSDQPLDLVNAQHEEITAAAWELGCILPDPFMVISFMSLSVIPRLKLTDQGLVDVERFEIVDLFMEE